MLKCPNCGSPIKIKGNIDGKSVGGGYLHFECTNVVDCFYTTAINAYTEKDAIESFEKTDRRKLVHIVSDGYNSLYGLDNFGKVWRYYHDGKAWGWIYDSQIPK